MARLEASLQEHLALAAEKTGAHINAWTYMIYVQVYHNELKFVLIINRYIYNFNDVLHVFKEATARIVEVLPAS